MVLEQIREVIRKKQDVEVRQNDNEKNEIDPPNRREHCDRNRNAPCLGKPE